MSLYMSVSIIKGTVKEYFTTSTIASHYHKSKPEIEYYTITNVSKTIEIIHRLSVLNFIFAFSEGLYFIICYKTKSWLQEFMNKNTSATFNEYYRQIN